ncbi:MAG: hypothetical protein R6U98_33710 [Pirellulaceae bacterium]
MSNQTLNPLVTPWWIMWGADLKRSPFFTVVREFWRAKLKHVRDANRPNLSWTALAERLGMDYDALNARRSGKRFSNSSLPVHEILIQAAALNADPFALLPTCPELFIVATTRLIRGYDPQSLDRQFGLTFKDFEAYVKYHFAFPRAQRRRRPDERAVNEAYCALQNKFKNAADMADSILKTATAIEQIYYHELGGQIQ